MRLRQECQDRAGPDRVCAFAASIVVLVIATSPALGQTPDFERFSLSLGAFVTDRSSDVQLDGSIPGSGTPVDLEKDLGLDTSTSTLPGLSCEVIGTISV